MERDAQLLPDHPEAVLSQMIFRGIIAHDRALQGIAEHHPLLLALDGKADMIRQGDQQGLV